MNNTTIQGHQSQGRISGPIKSTIQQDKAQAAQPQQSILKTPHDQLGTSFEQVESNSTRSRSTSNTVSISSNNSLEDYMISTLSAAQSYKHQQTRLSFFTRISQSFSKFISSFAFPKIIAAQKEKALNKILDGTGNKEELETLLKKESPMSTSSWASLRM